MLSGISMSFLANILAGMPVISLGTKTPYKRLSLTACTMRSWTLLKMVSAIAEFISEDLRNSIHSIKWDCAFANRASSSPHALASRLTTAWCYSARAVKSMLWALHSPPHSRIGFERLETRKGSLACVRASFKTGTAPMAR